MKNILLVEHQRLVSEGIHALLAMEEDLSINQTVSDEEKFYRLLRSYSYDLILMNLHIPHFNAIKATVHVKKHYPDMKVVHLTDFAEDHLVVEAILSGADGFLQTDIHANTFIQTLRQVCQGDVVISGEAAKILATKVATSMYEKNELLNKNLKNRNIFLTDREVEVAYLLTQGKSNEEIANELFLSEGTVKNYISELYTKLNVNRRKEMIHYLQQLTGICIEDEIYP